MKAIFRVMVWCICIVHAATLFAQQIPTRNYTMRDGLCHANVFRIMQDERGFMLFSTTYGISVFDSKVFHNYTRREGLPNNSVIAAAPYGPHKKVLCTYGGGLALLTDSGVTRFPVKQGEIPANVISAAMHGDALWIVGQHTKYRLYCIRSGASQMVNVRDRSGGQAIFLKIAPSVGELLFAAADGLYHLAGDDRVERLWPSLIKGTVVDAQYGKDSSCWVAQKDKLLQIKGNKIVTNIAFTGESTISDILAGSDGSIWVGTLGEGLYNVANGAAFHCSQYLDMPKVIINDLYEDADGSLWIATYGKGVYRIDGPYVLNYPPEHGVMNSYCVALAPIGNGDVVTGSIGTLSLYSKGSFHPMPSTHISPGEYIYFVKKRGSELIIGTPYALVAKQYRPPFAERIISFRGKAVSCISYFQDSQGRSWAGSFGQLYQIVGDSLVQQEMPGSDRINSIGEDALGTVWFGTDSGLIAYTQGRFTRKALPQLPSDTRVNKIFRDSRDRLWFATSEGLVLARDTVMMRFSTTDGLTHNKCNDIAEDTAGMLWVATINGISGIDINTLRIRDYRTQVYPNEVLSILPLRGSLLLGLVDGLTVMSNPMLSTESSPPLYITSIRTGTRSLPLNSSVSLPYWDNKLTIDFIAVSYRNADLISYRYKIAGLDKDWHYTSGNSIALSALPHGNYTLFIAASQNSGTWSPEVRLGIYVSLPFWKVWWFILAITLIMLVVILLTARWLAFRREKVRRHQLATYNKVTYLKQQALSALINPHFIFNCMNSIQHYLNRHDNDAANEYLADFAALIRMTMEQAQQAFITLEEEITRLRIYLSLEQLRFGEDLRYELVIDPALNLMKVRIPNMILQPYVENAILHGIMPKRSPGCVSIYFKRRGDEELEILIEDDGVGITDTQDAEGLRSPLGMKLTEERLQLLQGLLRQQYKVEIVAGGGSGKSQGTIVTLKVPLQPNEVLLQRKEEALNQ